MDTLSLFRRRLGSDLGALAEEHYRHEYALPYPYISKPQNPKSNVDPATDLISSPKSLTEQDRTNLQSAAKQASIWTAAGTALGLGLGLFAALRIRRTRARVFDAFRAAEKPTSVVFADGRTGMWFFSFPFCFFIFPGFRLGFCTGLELADSIE